MRAPETVIRADHDTVGESEERVNPWEDSVGAAAMQLGLILTLAITAHLTFNLLFGR